MSDFATINHRFKAAMVKIKSSMTEKAITELLITAGSYAATMTPIDTSYLLNSQYRKVEVTSKGMAGEIGYGANYALAVHSAPGKLKGLPRADFGRTGNHSDYGPQQVVSFGGGTGVGNYWDPGAEPGFLAKGMDEMITHDMDTILKSNYLI